MFPFQGTFALALSQSTSLQTLVDKSDSHATHGPRATLNRYHIRHIMSHVESLKTIISDSKVWTVSFFLEFNKLCSLSYI
jgi:hypothetical protein